jgi:8-oxo-dGTP pyrophosphatase MutT (NUDIX family)
VSDRVLSEQPDDWRRGAVLVPIFAAPPHNVLFVQRASHLRRHAGQIGFPGGLAEPADDGDPVVTALRELDEELGIAKDRVTVAGLLPETPQELNRFLISPVVGVLDAHARITLDGEEVSGVFTVPLDALLDPDGVRIDRSRSEAYGRTSYAFDYEGRHVWGFTGRVLRSFVDAWLAPTSSLREAVQSAWMPQG